MPRASSPPPPPHSVRRAPAADRGPTRCEREGGSGARRGRIRTGRRDRRILHLAVLTNFGLALPLLEVLGQDATFFVAHRAHGATLLAVAGGLCLGVPGLWMAIEPALRRRWGAAGRALYRLAICALAAAAFLTGLKRIAGVPGWLLVLAALLLGAGVGVLAARSQAMAFFLTFLAPVIVLTPVLFLFFSPAGRLLRAADPRRFEAVAVGSSTPVVMVVFDELSLPHMLDRSRRIDPLLYPNFAALSAGAWWFRNATTVAQSTRYAVPAILTGNYPDGDRLPVHEEYPDNLFSLLQGSYELRIFEPITDLCPPGVCRARLGGRLSGLVGLTLDIAVVYLHVLLPTDLAAGLPPVTDNWKDFRGGPLSRKQRDIHFADFLATLRSGEERGLYFLHSLLPHVPWEYLPSGKRYGGPDAPLTNWGFRAGRWGEDEWLAHQSFQRHLLQQRWTDRLLGDLLAALEAAGLYDRCLLVVTADHGVSFRPRLPRRVLHRGNYDEILPVPLLIKLPGQKRARVRDDNVEAIDILPTIAAVLGVEVPWPTDGRPLFDPRFELRRQKTAFPSARHVGAARHFDPSLLEAISDAAAKTIGLFGSGDDPEAIFRLAPEGFGGELIGEPAAALTAAGTPRVDVRLDGAHHYLAVDPAASFVPARIQGSLAPDPGAQVGGGRRLLAVGVNGTVRAVTRTFDFEHRRHFTALVPEESFVAGRNTIEIFDLTSTWEAANAALFSDGFESGTAAAFSMSKSREGSDPSPGLEARESAARSPSGE